MTDEKIKIEMTLDELAEIQHRIWSRWMEYLFECGLSIYEFDPKFEKVRALLFPVIPADDEDMCTVNDPRIGKERFLINSKKVTRWKRQMNTDYKHLSEEEKESDRKVVKEFLLKNEQTN